MLAYIQEMIILILGADFFTTYQWAQAFLEISLFFFAILILVLTYKLWKFILVGWWR